MSYNDEYNDFVGALCKRIFVNDVTFGYYVHPEKYSNVIFCRNCELLGLTWHYTISSTIVKSSNVQPIHSFLAKIGRAHV